MRNELTATPMIHKLVREGRASAKEGARLLQLRQEMQKQQDRPRGVFSTVIVAAAAFVLAMFGVRRAA